MWHLYRDPGDRHRLTVTVPGMPAPILNKSIVAGRVVLLRAVVQGLVVRYYSMTSSALASKVAGMARGSAAAYLGVVLRAADCGVKASRAIATPSVQETLNRLGVKPKASTP
jgi:hypothetical protein